MKMMIIGAGEIGRHLALQLSHQHHDIVILDPDDQVVAELGAQIDAKVVLGDGSSVDQLIESGVTECEIFYALTSSNNTNLVACSIAKQLGAEKVICRVHPSLQREALLFPYANHFGIDEIFSPERLAAVEFFKQIRNPDSIFAEEVARGNVEFLQFSIPEKTPVRDRTLAQLQLPERVRVGAIERKGRFIVPSANDKLRAHDLVTLIGSPRKIHEIAAQMGQHVKKRERQRVIIFGGGEYGFALAQMLESWNCRTRIFDADPDRCEELTALLQNTAILCIDATSRNELVEERVGKCDFFVATTGSDQDNVMTCLQAHELGAKHCLTLMHRADYADAITKLGSTIGILEAVSPREVAARELMRHITSDTFHIVKKLKGADIIESAVVEGSAVAGNQVKDIDWPEDCLIAAILRGNDANVPAPDDEIQVGDNLYAIVSHQTRKKLLQLLRPPRQ